MHRDTSETPRNAVRYTLIASVTVALLFALVGPAMVLTGTQATASAEVSGDWIYTGGNDDSARQLNSTDGSGDGWVVSASNDAMDTAVGPDEQTVFVAYLDGDIYGVDQSTGVKKWGYNAIGSGSGATGVIASRDGESVYGSVGGNDPTIPAIVSINASNGQEEWRQNTTTNALDVTLSLSGRTVYGAFSGGSVRAFDAGTGTEDSGWRFNHSSAARSVTVGPNNTYVYAGFGDGSVKALYKENGTVAWSESIHSDSVMGLRVNKAGDTIYSASFDNTVQATALSDQTNRWTFTGHSDQVRGLGLSPDMSTVYSASSDHFTKAIDADTGDQVWSVDAHQTNNMRAVAAGGEQEIAEGFTPALPTITGQVTDSETGDAIENADVTVSNASSGTEVVSTTTDGSGFYSVQVENGTYDVTADATDYFSETETVTIQGSSVIQDFTLTPSSAALVLEHRTYLEHGQQTEYVVRYQNITNGTVQDTEDVTDDATVTSGDVDVVTVNIAEQTLVATQNTSINRRTYIEAEYTRDGDTYVTRRNITVANQTTDNLEMLPGTAVRTSAVMLDTTIQALIVATFIGIIGARVATAFAGLGMMQMTIVTGWFIGYVSVGMAMVSLFTALFIGLNMAANIDYTVRR